MVRVHIRIQFQKFMKFFIIPMQCVPYDVDVVILLA
jgi:methylglyoxal synthase